MRAPAPFSSKLRFPLYSARFLPTPFSATHLLLWPLSKTEAGNTRVRVAPGESPLFPATALVACVASGSAGWAVPAESGRAGQGGAGSYLLLSIPGDVVQGKSASLRSHRPVPPGGCSSGKQFPPSKHLPA